MRVQCASVSSRPMALASWGASASSHWEGWVRKPSSLTSTSWPAMVVVLMVRASPLVLLGVFAGHRHAGGKRDGAAREQGVPVDVPERELADVVGVRLPQQLHRADLPEWEVAGQRLGLVVEVEQQGLLVAGLDEAVR